MENIVSTEQKTGASFFTDSMQELVLRRIRLYSRRRIIWLRKIWSEVADNRTEPFNAHTEVDGYLFDMDLPSLEAEWVAKDASVKCLNDAIDQIEQKLWNDESSRLSILLKIFGLSRMETDVLHACLAISIDPNLGRVFAYLQDNAAKAYVTENLVARLFRHGHCLLLDANAPLKTWALVKETISSSGEATRLECDPFIKNWLLGLNGIDENLNALASVQPAKEPLLNWPVKKVVDFIKSTVKNNAQNQVRIVVAGADGSGRRSFAATVCKELGLALLTLNVDMIAENRWLQTYVQAQRQAFLSNMAVAWYGSGIQERFWLQSVHPYPVQFVIGEPDSFILPEPGYVDLRVEIPVIPYEERLLLWRKFVPLSAGWPAKEGNEMILRHQVTIGQIVSIGQKMTADISEAYDALRADAGHRLGNLAQQMNSDFTWDDLVVPEYVKKGIEDFTYEATERIHFWEQPEAKRLFPQGRSLIALFTGSPGTGKTMAAQVVAATLKLDLFRIDLSFVVSKYIGESSKNIERILSRARTMNVVLFFDEADSLFGKRTEIKDAHDRYANTDTNYLLQAIEQYPGVIILASNKKSNIDSGFMRRFRYVFEFPKPDVTQRLQLWRRILHELAGEKNSIQLDGDLVRLSELVDITGAQIKLSILSAVFMARRDKTDINMVHILKGLERELIKEGRGLGRMLNNLT